MIPILAHKAYLERLLAAPRPNINSVLAFYEHRVGAICKDPELLLAPLDDHMFHRGDGVFEALKFVDGKIYQFTEHITRMQHSATSIRLNPPAAWAELCEAVLATTRAAGTPTGQIRLFLGRGCGGFGVDPLESAQSSFYVVVSRFTPPTEAWYEKGLKGFRSAMPAKAAHFSKIKDTNYLAAAMMFLEAHDKGMDTPLVFDAQGYLAESAVANICLVDKNGQLVVPEFKQALPGTTIGRALQLLEGKVPCVIRPVPESEIYEASELLLLGTSPNCASIVEYEGKAIGAGLRGPISCMLNQLIEEDICVNGLPF